MFHFHKTFCSKFSFINTKQNVHFIPFEYALNEIKASNTLTRDELAVYYYNRTISTTIKVIIPGNNIVATTSSQSNFPPHSLSL